MKKSLIVSAFVILALGGEKISGAAALDSLPAQQVPTAQQATTMLFEAIKNAAIGGTLDAVEQCLLRGADIYAKNQHGEMPIHRAAQLGNNAVVMLLVAKHKVMHSSFDMVNAQSSSGLTPLHYAVGSAITFQLGDPEKCVELLLAEGANPNLKDNSGRIPLHVVRDSNITLLLLDKGSDVNAIDKDGRTPLYYTVATPPFHLQGDRKLVIERMVALGAQINITDRFGKSPLYYALSVNPKTRDFDTDAPNTLIKLGANINNQDNNGNTLLHIMAHKGYTQHVAWLLEYDVDYSLKNKKGKTAAEIATKECRRLIKGATTKRASANLNITG